ncbi:MAG: ATP-binding protein [Parcubacteria group bacterium]|nr:ATP-binding protein [Parcubacteria group bacterium]
MTSIHHDPMSMHQGKALLTLARNNYPTVKEAVLEAVQNAIDADARTISILIKPELIAIMDDGDGKTPEEFSMVLSNIANSLKTQAQLGRHGLGFIAPLASSKLYQFISGAKSTGEYYQWTFESDKIGRQKDEVNIPRIARSDLVFSRNGFKSKTQSPVPWRTAILIREYTQDKFLGNIESSSLVQTIADRYRQPIQDKSIDIAIEYCDASGDGTKVKVNIEPFAGDKLPSIKLTENTKSGRCVFNLYVTPKINGKRAGRLYFGELTNPYRLTAKQFCGSVQGLLSDEIIDSFLSSIFSGEIFCHKVKIATNRKTFEQNDNLIGFCEVIEEWWQKQGRCVAENVFEDEKDRRCFEIGFKVQELLRDLFENNKEFKDLVDFFPETKLFGAPSNEFQEIPGGDQPAETGIPKKTRGTYTHHDPPLTGGGKHGSPKKAVRIPICKGLQLTYGDQYTALEPYEINYETGLVIINKRADLYRLCEVKDTWFFQYQYQIAVQAAILFGTPTELRSRVYDILNKNLIAFVHNIARTAHNKRG